MNITSYRRSVLGQRTSVGGIGDSNQGAIDAEPPKNNESPDDPTVNDDETIGYSVFSLWINTTSGDVFIALDVTDGAADWLNITSGSGDFLTVANGGGELIDPHGAMGATETIDLANGNVHTGTLDDDVTLTFAAVASGRARWMVFIPFQDGSGGHSITWPGSIVWRSGSPPTPDTTADTFTPFVFLTLDGGTTWIEWASGGGGSALTIEDEGTPLATAATSLDFVGDGVTATGAGAGKTITIPGVTAVAVMDAGRWEVVVFGSPPAPVTNPDDTDYVYAWVTD